MKSISITKKSKYIGEIVFDKKFPIRQEIDLVLKQFGHGTYELTAPNGRKWRVVRKDVISYLMDV